MYHSDKLADLIVVEPLASPTLRLKKEADHFSLDALIAWLEKQPGETGYDYCRPSTCLLGRYVIARGGKYCPDYTINGQSIQAGGLELKDSSPELYAVVSPYPWTYSAALQRALALRGDR